MKGVKRVTKIFHPGSSASKQAKGEALVLDSPDQEEAPINPTGDNSSNTELTDGASPVDNNKPKNKPSSLKKMVTLPQKIVSKGVSKGVNLLSPRGQASKKNKILLSSSVTKRRHSLGQIEIGSAEPSNSSTNILEASMPNLNLSVAPQLAPIAAAPPRQNSLEPEEETNLSKRLSERLTHNNNQAKDQARSTTPPPTTEAPLSPAAARTLTVGILEESTSSIPSSAMLSPKSVTKKLAPPAKDTTRQRRSTHKETGSGKIKKKSPKHAKRLSMPARPTPAQIEAESDSIPSLSILDLTNAPTKLVIESETHGTIETTMTKEDLMSPLVTKVIKRLPNGNLSIEAKEKTAGRKSSGLPSAPPLLETTTPEPNTPRTRRAEKNSNRQQQRRASSAQGRRRKSTTNDGSGRAKDGSSRRRTSTRRDSGEEPKTPRGKKARRKSANLLVSTREEEAIEAPRSAKQKPRRRRSSGQIPVDASKLPEFLPLMEEEEEPVAANTKTTIFRKSLMEDVSDPATIQTYETPAEVVRTKKTTADRRSIMEDVSDPSTIQTEGDVLRAKKIQRRRNSGRLVPIEGNELMQDVSEPAIPTSTPKRKSRRRKSLPSIPLADTEAAPARKSAPKTRRRSKERRKSREEAGEPERLKSREEGGEQIKKKTIRKVRKSQPPKTINSPDGLKRAATLAISSSQHPPVPTIAPVSSASVQRRTSFSGVGTDFTHEPTMLSPTTLKQRLQIPTAPPTITNSPKHSKHSLGYRSLGLPTNSPRTNKALLKETAKSHAELFQHHFVVAPSTRSVTTESTEHSGPSQVSAPPLQRQQQSSPLVPPRQARRAQSMSHCNTSFQQSFDWSAATPYEDPTVASKAKEAKEPSPVCVAEGFDRNQNTNTHQKEQPKTESLDYESIQWESLASSPKPACHKAQRRPTLTCDGRDKFEAAPGKTSETAAVMAKPLSDNQLGGSGNDWVATANKAADIIESAAAAVANLQDVGLDVSEVVATLHDLGMEVSPKSAPKRLSSLDMAKKTNGLGDQQSAAIPFLADMTLNTGIGDQSAAMPSLAEVSNHMSFGDQSAGMPSLADLTHATGFGDQSAAISSLADMSQITGLVDQSFLGKQSTATTSAMTSSAGMSKDPSRGGQSVSDDHNSAMPVLAEMSDHGTTTDKQRQSITMSIPSLATFETSDEDAEESDSGDDKTKELVPATSISSHFKETNKLTNKGLKDACDSVVLSKALKSRPLLPNSYAATSEEESEEEVEEQETGQIEEENDNIGEMGDTLKSKNSIAKHFRKTGSKKGISDAADSVVLSKALNRRPKLRNRAATRRRSLGDDTIENEHTLKSRMDQGKADHSPRKPSRRNHSFESELSNSFVNNKFSDTCDSVVLAQSALKDHFDASQERQMHSSQALVDTCDSVVMTRHTQQQRKEEATSKRALQKTLGGSLSFVNSKQSPGQGLEKHLYDSSPRLPPRRSYSFESHFSTATPAPRAAVPKFDLPFQDDGQDARHGEQLDEEETVTTPRRSITFIRKGHSMLISGETDYTTDEKKTPVDRKLPRRHSHGTITDRSRSTVDDVAFSEAATAERRIHPVHSFITLDLVRKLKGHENSNHGSVEESKRIRRNLLEGSLSNPGSRQGSMRRLLNLNSNPGSREGSRRSLNESNLGSPREGSRRSLGGSSHSGSGQGSKGRLQSGNTKPGSREGSRRSLNDGNPGTKEGSKQNRKARRHSGSLHGSRHKLLSERSNPGSRGAREGSKRHHHKGSKRSKGSIKRGSRQGSKRNLDDGSVDFMQLHQSMPARMSDGSSPWQISLDDSNDHHETSLMRETEEDFSRWSSSC